MHLLIKTQKVKKLNKIHILFNTVSARKFKKSIEEDEKKYKEMGKRLAEDRDYSKLFNKKS